MASMTIHFFSWDFLHLLFAVINWEEINLLSAIFSLGFFLLLTYGNMLYFHTVVVYQLSL